MRVSEAGIRNSEEALMRNERRGVRRPAEPLRKGPQRRRRHALHGRPPAQPGAEPARHRRPARHHHSKKESDSPWMTSVGTGTAARPGPGCRRRPWPATAPGAADRGQRRGRPEQRPPRQAAGKDEGVRDRPRGMNGGAGPVLFDRPRTGRPAAALRVRGGGEPQKAPLRQMTRPCGHEDQYQWWFCQKTHAWFGLP